MEIAAAALRIREIFSLLASPVVTLMTKKATVSAKDELAMQIQEGTSKILSRVVKEGIS